MHFKGAPGRPTEGHKARIIREAREQQPVSELKRKADKAQRRQNIWTQEDMDWAKAKADEMSSWLQGRPIDGK